MNSSKYYLPEGTSSNGGLRKIPEDILTGPELHSFCAAEIVIPKMLECGFSVEEVITDCIPVRVVAVKDERKIIVLVAGGEISRGTNVSCRAKQQFCEYCREKNAEPMLASVGMSIENMKLAKSGMPIKRGASDLSYPFNEKLTGYRLPEIGSPEHRGYCAELLLQAYCTGNFGILFDLFDDNIEFSSCWIHGSVTGKDNLIEFLGGKDSAACGYPDNITGCVAALTVYKYYGNFGFSPQNRIICTHIVQNVEGQLYKTVVIPEFGADGRLSGIILEDASKCNLEPYYAVE